jgi:hypothetical protein
MILFVDLEMFSQIRDPLGKDRYLNLRRTGISLMTFMSLDDFLFLFRYQHAAHPLSTEKSFFIMSLLLWRRYFYLP